MALKPDIDPVLVGHALSGKGENSEKLAELLLKRLAKQDAEEDEALKSKIAAHKAGMEAMIKRHEFEVAKQLVCPHKKPYGESALVGQRLHSHKYLYLCQYCSKEWFGDQVPNDLRISTELVGGPNY